MDAGYTGTYGRLKVLRPEFLSTSFMDELQQKSDDEFLKSLSSTSYRKEIDAFSSLYRIPDLMEVVINAHMMRMIRSAMFALPNSAKQFISSYLSKWDIENIKTILSSKVLGYDIEHTEAFLMVERNIPVGTFSGVLSRSEYINMISQKDVDGVVSLLVKYGYGTIMLKHIEDYKKTNDISGMITALDVYYYNNMINTFKFSNGSEALLLSYIKETIDIKNIMTVIKAIGEKVTNVSPYLIKGGTLSEQKLNEMASKEIYVLKNYIPYRIDDAFEAYKEDQFASYFDTALRREVYRKYLKLFESIVMSLEFIFSFVLRSEMERDELRTIWLGKYYKISDERTDRLRILKYIEK